MGVNLGEAAPCLVHQVHVILQGKLWVQASLEQNSGHALGRRLAHHLHHLVDGVGVGLGALFRSIEGAEGAIGVADVGVVQICVYDKGHYPFRVMAVPERLGQGREVEQAGMA